MEPCIGASNGYGEPDVNIIVVRSGMNGSVSEDEASDMLNRMWVELWSEVLCTEMSNMVIKCG